MARQALLSGAYTARSWIASAQRCLNLYPEENPKDSPFPFTDYPTPGLVPKGVPPLVGLGRGAHRAGNGELFVAIGASIYYVSASFDYALLGTIPLGTTKVAMADNGLILLIVDGSSRGWAVDLATHAFVEILDVDFYGGTAVKYADTYFMLNRPGTRQWYLSVSEIDFALISTPKISDGTITGGTGYNKGVATLSIFAAGTGYGSKLFYFNRPLTGGTGTGATADYGTGGAGAVNYVKINNPGTGYTVADALTAAADGNGDAVFHVTALLQSNRYANIALTGGSGTGARADITVTTGVVTAVNFTSYGTGYLIGDQLSAAAASIGGGTGFKFVVTELNTDAFLPLAIASKVAYSDLLATIAVMHREIYLIGQQTTEPWSNTGAPDFPYAIIPGTFIEHGCAAPYSVATQDSQIIMLGADREGQAQVILIAGYEAKRISTHAIEKDFQSYATIADAEGFCYQQEGHTFYVLNFPTADKTWAFDFATGFWHERAWTDSEGLEHRSRATWAVAAYGKNLCLDWEDGTLYAFDLDIYTDNGAPIKRVRSFPHIKNEDKRITYKYFIANFEVGNKAKGADQNVTLRFSDDGGFTWSDGLQKALGSPGQYKKSLKWNRLGLARTRTFELSWSCDIKTSLSGASLDPEALIS